MEFYGIKTSRHSTDGKMLHIEFDSDHGSAHVVGATATMATIAQELSAIASEARKADQTLGPRSVPVIESCHVLKTQDQEAALIRFGMPNGLEHLFALTPDQTKVLINLLRDTLPRGS